MQTPANHEDMSRRWCRSGTASRYVSEKMHLGSVKQDPGVSPAEILTPGSARPAQFAHFIPAPLLFPPNRYGAFPELSR